MTPPLGTRGPALAASTIPPLSVRPRGTRSATHKRDQTVAGPPQSPTRSFEGSGSQTDPEKIRESNPTRPIVPHGGTLRRRRVVYLVAPAKNPPAPVYNVAAGHSRRGHLRVSDAGGSRRSYRNGRASAVAEGTPFPRGPKSRLWGGGSWLAPIIQRTCWPPPGVMPQCPSRFPSRVRTDQAMATAFVSFRGGTSSRLCCVYCLTSYSHVVHREPGSGGRAPICRKVVRACSQPQGMFRWSGVGDCARPGEVPPQATGGTLCPDAAPETPFQTTPSRSLPHHPRSLLSPRDHTITTPSAVILVQHRHEVC